ncbi:MAG TPA: dihydrofolate reductase family protein [Azospirillum sp.]|nr:dihydrofolate reductase family protein [Azospirillum sp.]
MSGAPGARLLKLFPGPPEEVAVAGTYLAERLHALGGAGQPFVYASFVSSLDGRIALRDPATGASRLPLALTSENDLRLFLELQAQADCLVTNAGYLRDLAARRLDDVLQVGTPDLADWRVANGLTPQPAVVVVSASLDFPLPASPVRHAQRMLVATGASAPAGKVARLRERGIPVIVAGTGVSVEGAPLVRELGRRGYRSLYLLAGPRLFEAMLRDGMLARLYLTTTHGLLGGAHFQTMVAGGELGDAGRLRVAALRYDAGPPDGVGQWFAQYDVIR